MKFCPCIITITTNSKVMLLFIDVVFLLLLFFTCYSWGKGQFVHNSLDSFSLRPGRQSGGAGMVCQTILFHQWLPENVILTCKSLTYLTNFCSRMMSFICMLVLGLLSTSELSFFFEISFLHSLFFAGRVSILTWFWWSSPPAQGIK